MAEEITTNDTVAEDVASAVPATEQNVPDTTPTPDPESTKTVDATGGNDKPEQRPGEKTFTQEDVNRMFTDRYERGREKMVTEVEAKIRQEMAEARLFEDKKFEELAALNAQKAAAANAKLEEYERLQKVDSLLDVKEVLDPGLRALFRAVPGDLTDIDSHIVAHRAAFDEAVQKAVSAKLEIDTPPKSTNKTETKRPDQMSNEEWAAHKAANLIY